MVSALRKYWLVLSLVFILAALWGIAAYRSDVDPTPEMRWQGVREVIPALVVAVALWWRHRKERRP